jgi:3-oxoadipate enol-lactonase
MPYADLGSLKLYYEEYGPDRGDMEQAMPMLFLHGFTLDRRMWKPQADFFRQAYRVILLDSRGHGRSDAPQSGYSRADRVEDLHQFVRHLGVDRFHLIGLSMGGTTAIGYALEHQERLSSLTLVSTSAAGYDVSKKIARIDRIAQNQGLEAARTRWKETTLSWFKKEKQTIKALMEKMIDEHSGAVWLDPMRGRYPRENDLKRVHQITVATLIVAGKEDRLFLPLANSLHDRIPGSRLSIFENVGHMINLEEPDRFSRELKAFLEDID